MNIPKTRFAPSPTGLLHFGNIRTALFNALLAAKQGGVFLLRVEDTDAERSRDEYVVALMRDLRWLGLDWQEGGDAGGAAGPYRQSQRGSVYERFRALLEERGRIYPCFCTPLELEMSRKTQASAGLPPRYSGKCAHLTPREVEAKRRELPHSLRFRMPKAEVIEFEDMVRGSQRFPADEIGDFIIRRSDGSYAFFYVNALDDALMGVTHVMRGEDHLANTPRQIALLQALQLPTPRYGHISLIVDQAGAPLSKRSGSLSVGELREVGYFSLAILNYLGRLGHRYESSAFLDFAGLVAGFSVERLGRAPARYDRAQLDFWQAQAVLGADQPTLARWMAEEVREWVPAERLPEFAAAVRANVLFPRDARLWAEAVFGDGLPLSAEARAVLEATPPDFFRQALAVLEEPLEFKEFTRRLGAAAGVKGKALFQPLRAALTGQLHGPEMPPLFALMGWERIRRRLAAHVLNTAID